MEQPNIPDPNSVKTELERLAPSLDKLISATRSQVPGADASAQTELREQILGAIAQSGNALSRAKGGRAPRNTRMLGMRVFAAAAALAAAVFAAWFVLRQPSPVPEECLSFACQLESLSNEELSALVVEAAQAQASPSLLETAADDLLMTDFSSSLLDGLNDDQLWSELSEEDLETLLYP